MRAAVTPADIVSLGMPRATAARLAGALDAAFARHPDRTSPEAQARLWSDVRRVLLEDAEVRWSFDVHHTLFRTVYAHRRPEDGPAPAWTPSPDDVARSNLASLMAEVGRTAYADLHAWSVERREDFWAAMIRRLGIVFRTPPRAILDAGFDVSRPDWLPGASLNIAESCLRGDPARVAIVHASETSPDVRRMTVGELTALAGRVAHGVEALGTRRGERVAVYLPMTPESVAIYLGVVLAGRSVVGIADTSAPLDLAKRLRIGDAKAVFTIDAYVRDGKDQRIYDKVVEAGAPRAVVLPREGAETARTVRPDDIAWADFLGPRDAFGGVPCLPSDVTNVLFSSGTTKDPKAIPWTHVTPIKAAADAHLHHDVHPSDVVAWPTSFGWMMGPWLTYATLVNRAAMALYVGAPHRREFGAFVERAGVTILGIVPKLVRAWKADRTVEGLDWSRIRLFSSTAETSDPVEMLYLMFLAGYKPIIEYCGGTEVGGGYITGTLVQPTAPSTFSTPAMGLDFVILDDGRPADRGEAFLVPPSIGLSNDLLNYDHRGEYYGGAPHGAGGELLRRHGDQIERLAGGYFRHHGRVDDMININGVKTSAEEIRSVIAHELVYDAKPIAVDLDGSGQHRLVVYAVPRDPAVLASDRVRARLREDFQRAIKEKLNPLLAHVHDVVLIPELPQAGPGKTRTMKDLRRDYLARIGRR
ncbi:MAG: AMP-binding protein [Methanobacteriota archaeon]